MIVELFQEVKEHFEVIDSIQKAKNDAKNVEDTRRELGEVKARTLQLQRYYLTLGSRVGVGDLPTQAQSLKTSLTISSRKFMGESSQPDRRQVQSLQIVRVQLETLTNQFETRWKEYALAQIQPKSELLKLVQSLPELAEQLPEIQAQENSLLVSAKRLPTGQNELTDFDNRLQKLTDWLEQLEGSGLTPAVKAFLSKVLEGKAFLSDLNDEVLLWLRQGQRAHAFQISTLQTTSSSAAAATSGYRYTNNTRRNF